MRKTRKKKTKTKKTYLTKTSHLFIADRKPTILSCRSTENDASRLRVLIGQSCQSLKRWGHVNIKEKTLPVLLTVAGDLRAINEFLLHQIHFYVTKRLY